MTGITPNAVEMWSLLIVVSVQNVSDAPPLISCMRVASHKIVLQKKQVRRLCCECLLSPVIFPLGCARTQLGSAPDACGEQALLVGVAGGAGGATVVLVLGRLLVAGLLRFGTAAARLLVWPAGYRQGTCAGVSQSHVLQVDICTHIQGEDKKRTHGLLLQRKKIECHSIP